jgi:hypothetical protein
MAACVRVFTGVTIWRTVTAERHAARLAGAQMDPVRTDLHAFFAFAPLRLFNGPDCLEMRAALGRHCRDSCVLLIRLGEPKLSKPSFLRNFENLDLLGNAAE